MKSFKLKTTLLLISILLGNGIGFSQKQYQENAKISHIFKELDRKFPKTYLIRQTNDWIIYDLQYWFKSESDRLEQQKMFDSMFKLLDEQKHLRKYIEAIDEPGKRYTKYSLTIPSGKKGQIDFILLEVGNNNVIFQYKVNADANGTRYRISNQKAEEIKREIQTLYNQYTRLNTTTKQQVTYDWKRNKYHRFIAADNTTLQTRGTKYIIPDCTTRDYEKIVTRFKQIQQKYNIFMASNDVFWEYEEAAITFRNHNGLLINYGVALKDNGDLCLIETTSGALPRLWAEENAVWEEAKKLRPYYKTPDNSK